MAKRPRLLGSIVVGLAAAACGGGGNNNADDAPTPDASPAFGDGEADKDMEAPGDAGGQGQRHRGEEAPAPR